MNVDGVFLTQPINDINDSVLKEIGNAEGIGHMSVAKFPSSAFPIRGKLYGPNNRCIAPLVLQKFAKPNSPVLSIWCIILTTAPCTFLTQKTLEAFEGPGNVIQGKSYPFAVQNINTKIECRVSRSPIEHLNVIGVDTLRQLGVSMRMDWNAGSVLLEADENTR